ncbi:hypothetical protein IFM89_013779 [Coptis chinensis]|uniref:Uncharacterized protein n=1 Tax=Coptis chinensis TaxID=261450 RepID=A0A835LVT7_9MAGN|nr:hypothetical protein IFM89_013779 [Coptis chinensis]
MGEALLELEQILKASKDKMTREEADVFNTSKANAIKDFTLTTCITSGIAWTALRKLGYGMRISLSGGTALVSGWWSFTRCLDSSVDNILAMEGSRMQNELANIILTKNQHDPWRMQLLKKHFYPEKVFDDSNSDQPISRWRLRNFFSDDGALSQISHDSNTNDNNSDSGLKQCPESMQFTMRPAVEASDTDPFDIVFGYSGPPEEIHHPENPTDVAPKRRNRSHRRTQRRHRIRHSEVDTTL